MPWRRLLRDNPHSSPSNVGSALSKRGFRRIGPQRLVRSPTGTGLPLADESGWRECSQLCPAVEAAEHSRFHCCKSTLLEIFPAGNLPSGVATADCVFLGLLVKELTAGRRGFGSRCRLPAGMAACPACVGHAWVQGASGPSCFLR